jgi:TonB family protein
MNKSLGLSLIAFFITVGCSAQFDTLIYYGPRGAISQKAYAVKYIRVESSTKKKSKLPTIRLWTYHKYDGEWSKSNGYKELVKKNDSIYWIYSVENNNSKVQVKRTVNTSPNGLYIRDYSPSGMLEQEGYSKSIFPLHKVGLYKSYYSSGVLMQNAIYSENEETANQNWNTDGTKTLDNVFGEADKLPGFKGGLEGLMNYLGREVMYPRSAMEAGIQGIVYVSFVVMEDGSIAQIGVLRGIGGGCDEASITVVQDMPKWIPGSHRGKLARIQFNLPVRFVLR